VARELRAEDDGIELRGTIQHRSYLWRLERGEVEAFALGRTAGFVKLYARR